MKTTVVLTFAAALAASVASAVDIPAEHQQRFLREQAAMAQELAQWKQSEAGQYAKANGLYKEESLDNSIQFGNVTVAEDDLKRFYLAKQSIAEAEKANPDATFSVNTPFALMTDEEFAQHVGHSFMKVDPLTTRTANTARNTTTSTPVTVIQSASDDTATRHLAVKTSVDWTTSGCVSHVKNQGDQCASCWAFAAVGALESINCIKNGKLELFSDQQATSCDPVSSGCYQGAAYYALNYLSDFGGVCTEASYPYISGRTNLDEICYADKCNKKELQIGEVVVVDQTEAALLEAIAQQPVAVTLSGGNNEWKYYAGGVLSSCSTTDLDHAGLAVGYDATSIKVKNQWGPTWGENGYIRLKRNGDAGTCEILSGANTYPVLTAPGAPKPALASCPIIKDGIEYTGENIGRGRSPNAEGCCTICNSFGGCYAYTWTNENGGICWLKGEKGAMKKTPGVRSSVVDYDESEPAPASTPAPAPVPSPACSTIEENTDYSGPDVGNSRSGNAEGCCSICKSFDGCNAFTWTNYNGGTCWLKSDKGAAKYAQGVRAAVINSAAPVPSPACSTIEENTDYSGPDVGNVPSATVQDCCAICATKSGCGAYTWTNYNGGTCWLKGYRGMKKSSTGARSAVVNKAPKCNLESDVDFAGSDLANAPSTTAAPCCDLCRRRSKCKAFTWTNYSGGTCWLKSAAAEGKAKAESVSGSI